MAGIIDAIIERHNKIIVFLRERDEVSLQVDSDDEFRKTLVLSVASYFESEISRAILNLAKSTGSDEVCSFIKNKAVSRQYHTFFDWNGKNVNGFLKLFGDSFKDSVQKALSENQRLQDGAKAFLKLGNQRNTLVHENFASVPLEWSADEIVTLYETALDFVSFLSERIQNGGNKGDKSAH
jgi:hypothetical protein